MRKRALILASVASMIDQFNMSNIQLLIQMGYGVDVIADFVDGGSINADRIENLKERLSKLQVTIYHVAIPRSISNIKGIMNSYKEIKHIMAERNYSLIHCHSPIGGVLCRLAAKESRKQGAKVIYTAHGFHFYKGAPLKNWIVFYPIEKFCSRYTDTLITINREDYAFAKKHMKAQSIEYVPGIGVDTKAFAFDESLRFLKRKELKLRSDDFALLSVGELNKNKNHETVIKAISQIEQHENIHYFIVGKGDLGEYLSDVAKRLNVNLHLLGYQTCMHELYCMSDIFVFPSIREGLPVSLMEAMACGLPCVVSRIRGNTDLIDDGKGGLLTSAKTASDFFAAITKVIESDEIRREFKDYNQSKVLAFDKKVVLDKMRTVYSE